MQRFSSEKESIVWWLSDTQTHCTISITHLAYLRSHHVAVAAAGATAAAFEILIHCVLNICRHCYSIGFRHLPTATSIPRNDRFESSHKINPIVGYYSWLHRDHVVVVSVVVVVVVDPQFYQMTLIHWK